MLYLWLAPPTILGMVILLARLLSLHKNLLARILVVGFIDIILWISLDWFAIIVTRTKWALLFEVLAQITVVFTPVIWLIFSLFFVRSPLRKNQLFLISLFIIPAFSTLAILTNSMHGLFWVKHEVVSFYPLTEVKNVPGILFYVHTLYSYLLVVVSFFLLYRHARAVDQSQKRDAYLLLSGVLVPILVNIIDLFALIPGFNKDFTPIFFSYTCFAFNEVIRKQYRKSKRLN